MIAPRRDQLRNRRVLVDAAVAAVLEQGPEVSMDALAGAAGLGVSTLYRHFPTRDAVMRAVLDELNTAIAEEAARAGEIEDPVAAFEQVFLGSCVLAPPEAETFARIARSSRALEAHAQELIEGVVAPSVRRLSEAGRLRPGVTAADVASLIRMIETGETAERRVTASRVVLAGILV